MCSTFAGYMRVGRESLARAPAKEVQQTEYVQKITKNRTKLISRDIDMSCEGLRSRILPPKELKPLKPFSVAYARIVYEGYEFIEDELRSGYHPQNFFCYSVDSKANDEFNRRIEALQKCFPNVLITKARFDINRFGLFMNHAYYECFKLLADKPGWGYLILMQVRLALQ
ncbi:Core-2/I-Branching enzyme [Ancylostoma caninum]|uniref:Core-2/I-Branching enzyme n=1 Tax=Ancylostoma caninum TaxID=29170 RepID=A0A368FF20_ANCCA|nr:Core-2/I-Branching enzyme [Ancylostoma caninum]